MHTVVTESLEEYLAGTLPASRAGELEAHLAACLPCREEAAALREQSLLLQLLRPTGAEPRPGFYARVMDQIEAQRATSFWNFFLEPSLGRRLMVAAATLVVLLGTFLVATMGDMEEDADSPIVAADAPGPVLGPEPEPDRNAILVSLTSYSD